jgi:hypothetical protein
VSACECGYLHGALVTTVEPYELATVSSDNVCDALALEVPPGEGHG